MFDDNFANESNNFTSLALLIFPATSELAPPSPLKSQRR
jgi:hypothetical protein